MARTAITLNKCTQATGVINPTADTIDAANGMSLALKSGAIPADSSSGLLLFQVKNTFAGSKAVTFKAGVNPPSFRADLGDLSFTMAQNDVSVFGPFEPARFLQSDGSINVDFAASMTGTILALLVPRGPLP